MLEHVADEIAADKAAAAGDEESHGARLVAALFCHRY